MTTTVTRTGTQIRVLSIAALMACSIPLALAADWPAFKPGQWQFERTIEGMGPTPQKVSRTECVDPTAEQAVQRGKLTKAGCTFSPTTQSGTTYRYSATCKIGGMNSTSNSVLEAKSTDAYTLTVDSITGDMKTHEVMTARRKGDCPK